MNGCSAENADLDKLVKDHPAEMEVLSEEIFYQSVPEQVMDYWPKWFSVSIPNADSQYRRQPFIYQKVNDNDNQKHFSGPMSYYTAIQTKYEVQIVHFVSNNEAIRLTSCKIPEGMEFIGIAHGGYLLYRDEQGIEQIQISNSEIVNFDIWKAENSYDKANYYVES